MSKADNEWFKNWFDTEYYHILYKNRDWQEAELFIDNLISNLKINTNSLILDMPCGKGRHSIYLNKKGFNVTGVDLSPHSIQCSNRFANATLAFFVHDMRKVFKENYFDAVLNLFTSIGYFENKNENADVINAAAQCLKTGGIFVLDFMNVKKTVNCLVDAETKQIDGILFEIKRWVEKNNIIKQIDIIDGEKKFTYFEKVNTLTLADFTIWMNSFNIEVTTVFGNYSLSPFNENTSERLIIIGKKHSAK